MTSFDVAAIGEIDDDDGDDDDDTGETDDDVSIERFSMISCNIFV